MGLVRGWELDAAGHLEVRLRVTSPLCAMAGHFVGEAEERLRAIVGVQAVSVIVDSSLDWTPEEISPAGQQALARGRELARRRLRGAGDRSAPPQAAR